MEANYRYGWGFWVDEYSRGKGHGYDYCLFVALQHESCYMIHVDCP